MSQDLQTTSQGAVVAYDYGKDAGSGFEGQTAADLSIPFLSILQANSPQVEEGKFKSGQLFNTVTEEAFDGDEGVLFVPACTEHCFVEWIPRNQGGGFVARFDPTDDAVAKALANAGETGKPKTANGNDLVETFYVYGVLCQSDTPELAVIAFTSSKIKKYRKFMTKVRKFADTNKVPLFANLVRITTVKEQNTKGKFSNFVLTPANGDISTSLLAPTDPRFIAAKKCKDMVRSGTAKAAYDSGKPDSDEDGVF